MHANMIYKNMIYVYVYHVAVHHVAQVQIPQDICSVRHILQHRCGALQKRIWPENSSKVGMAQPHFFRKVPEKCTDFNLTLLCILTLGTYTRFAWKNKMPALGVCFPQPCLSAGFAFYSHARALATGLLRQDHVRVDIDQFFRFHKKNAMKCLVN